MLTIYNKLLHFIRLGLARVGLLSRDCGSLEASMALDKLIGYTVLSMEGPPFTRDKEKTPFLASRNFLKAPVRMWASSKCPTLGKDFIILSLMFEP